MLNVKTLYRLAALGTVTLICACSGGSDNSGNSGVGLELPEIIRGAQAVNQDAITATVIVGERRIALTRNGDSFSGTITIASGSEISYVLEISEQVGSESIVLAQMTGTRQITNDTEINLFRNQYSYPDNDADGFNNLAEREAGSDHANSNSTPDNIEGDSNNDNSPGVLQFLSDTYSVDEESGTLQVSVARIDGSDGNVGVSYRLTSETAIAGQDYADNTGELLWLDGDTTPKVIDLEVFSDTDFEGEQTFAVNLYSVTGGAAIGNGFARVTIRDSTPAPQRGTLQLSARSIEVEESSGQAIVLVERVDGSEGLVTVDYLTTDGTAKTGEDYTGIIEARTLAWSDGDSQAKRISIPIIEDNFTESVESFSLMLKSVRGGAALGVQEATIKIIDTTIAQPQYGAITIETADLTVAEGSTAVINVQRRNGSDGDVSVQYTTSAGTAGTQDFISASGTLTWEAGDSTDKTISIATQADDQFEQSESFSVVLSGVSGGADLQQSTATVSISDATESNFGSLSFEEIAGAVDEGESITLSVARSGTPNSPVTLSILFDQNAASEIELDNTSLSWTSSETGSKSITISALSDTITNDSLSVSLTLTATDGTPTITDGTFTLTVNDTSRPGFIDPLPTDGEWEVCLAPYSTVDASAFSSQPSALTGATVTCIKACPDGAAVDTTFTGWGWDAADLHSCVFTDSAPGTITKVPVYLPERESFTLALSSTTFVGDNLLWSCQTENRTNAASPYTAEPASYLWLRFLEDGTYSYASTTDAEVPVDFTGPALWNVAERFLSIGHIGEVYRNVKVESDAEILYLYQKADTRLHCVVSPTQTG